LQKKINKNKIKEKKNILTFLIIFVKVNRNCRTNVNGVISTSFRRLFWPSSFKLMPFKSWNLLAPGPKQKKLILKKNFKKKIAKSRNPEKQQIFIRYARIAQKKDFQKLSRL